MDLNWLLTNGIARYDPSITYIPLKLGVFGHCLRAFKVGVMWVD